MGRAKNWHRERMANELETKKHDLRERRPVSYNLDEFQDEFYGIDLSSAIAKMGKSGLPEIVDKWGIGSASQSSWARIMAR
jgi:hypothetical protein